MILALSRMKILPEMVGQSCFIPAGSNYVDEFKKIKYGSVYKCELKKMRNPRHHALVFGLARCILSNMPEKMDYLAELTPYEFIKTLMLEIGQTEKRMKLNGEFYQIPKSISFENMSEDEFEPISKALFTVCAKILGIDVDELKKNYQDYL